MLTLPKKLGSFQNLLPPSGENYPSTALSSCQMIRVSSYNSQHVRIIHITYLAKEYTFSLVLIWQHLRIIVSVLSCPSFISLFQQHYNGVCGSLNIANSIN